MMLPTWNTPAGSLGYIPEGSMYTVQLDVTPPYENSTLTYKLQAGLIPAGITVFENGTVSGIPFNNAINRPESSTYKFTVRVTSETDIDGITETAISDRTFTITIATQRPPEFITDSDLGTFIYGMNVNVPIKCVDRDISDKLEYFVVLENGENPLPSGLSLSKTGILTGYVYDDDASVVENNNFDVNPFDTVEFGTETDYKDTYYSFTVGVTDGKETVQRTFTMHFIGGFDTSSSIIDASTIEYTADFNDTVVPVILSDLLDVSEWVQDASSTTYYTDTITLTADETNVVPTGPVRYYNDWGIVNSRDYFAKQIQSYNPSETATRYYHTTGQLPPGLVLDSDTGWVYGTVTHSTIRDTQYVFGVEAANRPVGDEVPDSYSTRCDFAITVRGLVGNDIMWNSDSFLGTISNAEPSVFSISAKLSNFALRYELIGGQLPPGLELLPDGSIVGRLNYGMISIDEHDTTFDLSPTKDFVISPTTLDRTFTFDVRVTTPDDLTTDVRRFTIEADRENLAPSNRVYSRALLDAVDRDIIRTITFDRQILNPRDTVYRPSDKNFGTASGVEFDHVYGLLDRDLDDYTTAIAKNHYRKQLTLAPFKSAVAMDDNGDILYEVVYSPIIDHQTNNGTSAAKELDFTRYAVNTGTGYVSQTETVVVYPNSLENMRTELQNNIGIASAALPRWMASNQPDGSVIGYIPAWVVAYVKPGHSQKVAYQLNAKYGSQLNEISFMIDRLYVERYWDLDDSSHEVFAFPQVHALADNQTPP